MHYLPLTPEEIRAMLGAIGVGSVEELFNCIPENLRLTQKLDMPEAMSELELRRHIVSLASKNYDPDTTDCFAGGAAFNHYIPSAVDHLSSLPELLTAYTPYQPELSQGTLTAIFEWQTCLSNLTGLPVANASLYDGATAVCEAARMCCTHTRKNKVVVSGLINPSYLKTLETFAKFIGFEVVVVKADGDRTDKQALVEASADAACVIVQSPNVLGTIEDVESLSKATEGITFVQVVAEAASLGLLKRPGDMGAKICCGEAQSFGIPMGFGGPHLGFISATVDFMRKLPGRIVGESVDRHGNRALTLTLRPREQDIRREKATSNICTNNGNCMLRAIIYLSLLGKKGLRDVAKQSYNKAHYLADKLKNAGLKLVNTNPFFNEFVIELPNKPADFAEKMVGKGFVVSPTTVDSVGSHHLVVAVTEMNSKESMDGFVVALSEVTR
ncbi:MAG TPA: aminomethyl-transferring glycine dehydrogenase subunit GcvPA [Caldisericia bacterium]|nr:aminomethyl-transferring glycine dehydrogenase subunit GcvPA [Caldisericia bacterium]HPF49641.1 aminomethyl-transferring glycine dehydrogenase subunit GcvPA [Caldisericia bacterium]HPI84623.1 aminomethyl-transferring glycine dehydrogenase subunit GcvPA [Caldisericia bacterium]HPQ92167.1 aminomethyl-transferring glycine dehydrogenase subunit GcvPA [Caldisericia bacterium]HRV74735.1 aminomethyl-transferring glycine dehydrogenase subunit GcvPA [Caldisericia bacterium]